MSLRLQLLQVARLAPRLLADSTHLVKNFFERQFNDQGAASDRAGKPDLYYTIFALAGAQALDATIPFDKTRAWLKSFADGSNLDLVHLGALARCWAVVSGASKEATTSILANLEKFRKIDGGYNSDHAANFGTAYDAFVALGAYEDLAAKPPDALDLVRSLKRLETADHAWSNRPDQKVGNLNATAGAVTLITHLGFPVNSAGGDCSKAWKKAATHRTQRRDGRDPIEGLSQARA